MSKYDPNITVCSACRRASCWQGIFYCDDYLYASTTERKVSTLIRYDEEHPDYWNNELNSANKPLLTPEILKALGATGDKLELAEEVGVV